MEAGVYSETIAQGNHAGTAPGAPQGPGANPEHLNPFWRAGSAACQDRLKVGVLLKERG